MDRNNNDQRNPILQYRLGGYQPRTAHYARRGIPEASTPDVAAQPPAPTPISTQIHLRITEAPQQVQQPVPTPLTQAPPRTQQTVSVPVAPVPPRPQSVPIEVPSKAIARPTPTMNMDIMPVARPQRISEEPTAPAYIFDDIEIEEITRRKSGGFAKLAAGLTLLLMFAVGVFGGWTYREKLTGMASNLINKPGPAEVLSKSETKSADSIEAVPFNDEELGRYQVPAAAPRFISIPQLLIKARVIEMNLSPDTGLEVPANVYDVGWLRTSAQPGKDGVVVLDGLGGGINENAVFREINTLQTGSIIEIENGEGSKFRYGVKHSEVFENGNLDLEKVQQPFEAGKKSLNIMACSGSTTDPSEICAKLYVVYASEI